MIVADRRLVEGESGGNPRAVQVGHWVSTPLRDSRGEVVVIRTPFRLEPGKYADAEAKRVTGVTPEGGTQMWGQASHWNDTARFNCPTVYGTFN